MTQHGLLDQILETALKISTEKESLLDAFKKSGITVGEDYHVTEIAETDEETLEKLMVNLTKLPVVKISAKQVIRKAKLGEHPN